MHLFKSILCKEFYIGIIYSFLRSWLLLGSDYSCILGTNCSDQKCLQHFPVNRNFEQLIIYVGIKLTNVKENGTNLLFDATSGLRISSFPSLNSITVGNCLLNEDVLMWYFSAVSGERERSTFANLRLSKEYLKDGSVSLVNGIGNNLIIVLTCKTTQKTAMQNQHKQGSKQYTILLATRLACHCSVPLPTHFQQWTQYSLAQRMMVQGAKPDGLKKIFMRSNVYSLDRILT